MLKAGLLAGVMSAQLLAAPFDAGAQTSASDAILRQVDRPAVVTHHVGVFNGARVRYTTTVEGLVVGGTETTPKSRIVSFAYTRDGADPVKRPVIFLFNGGPIVPSLYVHMGLGPKRVSFPDDIKASPSTYRLVDNTYSPLDVADLVFVDPASTGFSRALPGTPPSDYFSIKADARQVGEFIRAWMKAHGRTGPVYLFGESYGTNRAAEIASQFADSSAPFPLAGMFLYGQAVNIIEYSQRPANVTSYIASFPTIAAIGWFHGKAERNGRTFDQYMADAWNFAKGAYLAALYRGNELPDAERRLIATRLQEFSGVPASWYLDHALKITKEQYRVELLKDQKLLLGRMDARYTAPITEKGAAADPAEVLVSASETFFRQYLRQDLKVDWPDPYVTTSPVTSLDQWGWGDGISPFADWPYYQGVTKMMQLSPSFRLVVGNGYYDTQTTIGAQALLAAQSGWDPARVTLREYQGGHTAYSVGATAEAMADDIRRMVGHP